MNLHPNVKERKPYSHRRGKQTKYLNIVQYGRVHLQLTASLTPSSIACLYTVCRVEHPDTL